MPGKKYNLRSVKAEKLTFDASKDEDDTKRTNAEELAEWSGGRIYWVSREGNTAPQVAVPARSGTKVANVGDYVVELNEGNFTTMTEADFDRTYES